MIPYLVGNETASAPYMNALFQEFDDKLTKMMAGGKSFFLAQGAALPAKFSGKAFFFTTGRTVYASRVFGWVDGGGGTTRPYNHSQFTSAVTAIDPTKITWDEVNKIALVPAFPASVYAGLPTAIELTTQKPVGTGFLDWSLQAHTILHQGVSDTKPVPYYIQEASVGTGLLGTSVAAEKHYRFCLAEIILEGPTSVTLPATFDKYSCFRIHNFNSVPATLNFGTDYTVTLKPYSCATVRRDPAAAAGPGKNYRAGFNYFFKFEGGDPRFYWFAPKAYLISGNVGLVAGDGTVITNSMQANNLTNPAILHDWVNYFIRDLGPAFAGTLGRRSSALDQNGFYAGWQQDASVQADISGFYKNYFGDPAKPTTLLGDLIHHQGDIMIVRSSKTLTDPVSGKPVIVLDKVTFKGYATIIPDFAAKKLTVAENGSGDLVISNADTDNNVYLVPYGTNLLKTGETHPTIFSLVAKNFTIENAVFENPDPLHLSSTAPQLIFQPMATQGSTSKTWSTWDANTKTYDTPQTSTGNPQTTLNWSASRSTAKVLHGIHKIKVSDLLTLDFWGDPNVAGQNSSFVKITNQKLTLTPEGLVLTYTETDSAARAPTDSNWINLARGVPTVKSISLRSHGFGYFSAANGSKDTGWLSARSARYQFASAYANDFIGQSGQDFQVQGEPTQSTISVLGRLKLSGVTPTTRFFTTTPNDNLLKFLQNAAADQRTFGALFASSADFSINNGSAPVVTGAVTPISMALLPEMYNGMARAVNALNRASPLSWKCLRWNVFGKTVGLSTASPWELLGVGSWDPNTNATSFLSPIAQDSGSLQSGVGVPGFFYQMAGSGSTPLDGNSGWALGDYALFTPEGVWVKGQGLADPRQFISQWGGISANEGYSGYPGLTPMECFAVFDPGSQFESLCRVIGIPVKTVADLPGAATGESLAQMQNKIVANGIILDEVTVVASGGNATFDGINPPVGSANLTGTLYSEFLSTKALVNGQATGTQCLGVWSDGLLQAGSSNLVNAGYGDIGKYWVVPDDSTLTAGVWSSKLGQIKRGDMVFIIQFSGDPSSTLYGVVQVTHTPLGKQKGITIEGLDLNIYSLPEPFRNNGSGIRWITITDVQKAVEALGFQFSFIERCIPVSLFYFEEAYAANPIFSDGGSKTVSASGSFTGPSQVGSPFYIPPTFSLLLNPDARLGNLMKCCAVADAGALWKSTNFSGGGGIFNINPNITRSPILHATNAKMVFDPHLAVGAAFGPVNASGNGQFIGPSADIIGANVNENSTYYVGYTILGFAPQGSADELNLLPSFPPSSFYQEGWHARQFASQAFIVRHSASFQSFPAQVVLLGNETWTRPPEWWTQSLLNANWYLDGSGDFSPSQILPWQYLSTPAQKTITLDAGINVISAGPNTNYTLLTNIGAPLIAL